MIKDNTKRKIIRDADTEEMLEQQHRARCILRAAERRKEQKHHSDYHNADSEDDYYDYGNW